MHPTWVPRQSPMVTMPPRSLPVAPSPVPMPPPRSSARRWARTTGVLVVVGMAITAIVLSTIALTRSTSVVTPPAPQPAAATPQFSAGEQAAAKAQVCHAFDMSTRGPQGRGGVRTDGVVNTPVVLWDLNSAMAVQNTLSQAVPTDVAERARQFISASLNLSTAAMSDASTDENNRLNDIRNTAIDNMVTACGLSH
jgi:hypothetical protein